jgi:hypothetical protein
MIKDEGDWEERQKMISALKQWARIYTFPDYPWRLAKAIRLIAKRVSKMAERNPPALNIPHYQDVEVSQGFGEILDSLYGLYDNYDNKRFDYSRQGERPVVDTEMSKGDFLPPSAPPVGDTVKERGDGPDPEGMENPFPPTGGDVGGI